MPGAQHTRVYSKDEELGKRDDDFRPLKRTSTATSLLQPWRWRKRRLVTVLAMTVLVYLFWRQLASALNVVEERFAAGPRTPLGPVGRTQGRTIEPTGPPPRPRVRDEDDDSKHYYDGPIKFYRLATTLHSISKTLGIRPDNRNVLFATASLQSAANLMPMACEMARWDRNYVHMAFLGRDPLPVDDILEINGVVRGDCTVYFHDARGDYSEYSTDKRAEVAVAGAMKHINDFMHPQAIIMDDSTLEEAFFTRAMKAKVQVLERPLIEVPAGRYEEFIWMTRLDSGSLRNWVKPTVDIVIHVPPDSSGGLIRLLKGLEEADYSGFTVPKLTVEIPSDVEPFAKTYLERMVWPPGSPSDPRQQGTLTLRHRIPSTRLSSDAASVRFVESFFPARAEDNHILVLSSQAEIGPLFMQYLTYAILEYKYSSFGSSELHDLLGISLDVPTNYLNGSGLFRQPLVVEMPESKYSEDKRYDQVAASFLYQAPSSTASLIFGDKWSTFHDFLSNRLTISHLNKAQKTKKLVSKTEPAWLEYLLELMRVRGWSMMHPALPFVTVHNELARVPEEFMRDMNGDNSDTASEAKVEHFEEDAFLVADESPTFTKHVERATGDYTPLHDVLPFDGDLPELAHLPYLSYNGERINITFDTDLRTLSAPLFRRLYGGCSSKDAARKRIFTDPSKTGDLFCLPGVDIEYDDADDEDTSRSESAPAETAQAEPDLELMRSGRIAAMARVVGSHVEETQGAGTGDDEESDVVDEG